MEKTECTEISEVAACGQKKALNIGEHFKKPTKDTRAIDSNSVVLPLISHPTLKIGDVFRRFFRPLDGYIHVIVIGDGAYRLASDEL